MKVAVMADSTGYLPQEIIDKYNIPIAPLSVTFDDGIHLQRMTNFQ